MATNLAVEAVNAEGGINGSLLEIEIVDTAAEPDQAVVGYRELADEGVFAVSGPLSSGEAEVLFPQAPEVMVPIITGTANVEGITDPGEGWALRNTATNTALYTEAMPAWASEYGVSTAVLVFDEQQPVTAAAAENAIPAVAAEVGVEIVNADDPVTFATGQGDFASTVQRIGDLEADGLIVMSFPPEAGLLARELARQGDTRPVLGHPAQGGATFYEQGGTDINDWVLPSIFNRASEDPDTQAYVAAMTAADPEPPTVPEAANYYDNILMLAEVMREAGIDGTCGSRRGPGRRSGTGCSPSPGSRASPARRPSSRTATPSRRSTSTSSPPASSVRWAVDRPGVDRSTQVAHGRWSAPCATCRRRRGVTQTLVNGLLLGANYALLGLGLHPGVRGDAPPHAGPRRGVHGGGAGGAGAVDGGNPDLAGRRSTPSWWGRSCPR